MIKTKSYFPKILRDFLLTLIVPILALILLFWQSGNVIKEQILVLNKNTLNQFFEVIDTTIYEMRRNGYLIAQQKEVTEYANYAAKGSKDITYSVQNIMDILSASVSENHYDLLVYYPGNKRIVSGKYGSVEVDIYCDVNYGGESLLKQLDSILESDKRGTSLHVIEQKRGNPLLCIALKKSFVGNHAKDYVVLQVIEPDYLDKIMRDVYQSDDGVLLMFNEEKELLISSDNKQMYHLEGYKQEADPYEAEIEGNRYMMQVKSAESIDGYYAVAVNHDVYWKKLSNLRLICLSGSVACILTSLFVAWRGSKRTYSPFINIIGRIEEKKQLRYDAQVLSEVEFINKIYEKELDERKHLERRDKKEKLDDFIIALLYGEIDSQYVEGAFAEHAIKLCSGQFSVAVIDCVKSEIANGALLAFSIKNVFEELFNQNNMGYLIRISDMQYVLLINIGGADSVKKISDVLLYGKDFFEKHFKIGLTIAVSDIHEGMSEIPICYQEAKIALRYKYLLGEEECIPYCQINNRNFNYTTSLESKLSKMVIGYIHEKSPEMTSEQFVRGLFEMYGIDKEASLETVDCFKYEILSVINKAIAANKNRFIDYKARIEELLSQSTLEKFEIKFAQIIFELWKEEQDNAEEADICDRARKYISEHYMDTELSVNMLADKLKISSYYLSKLFKDKYGTSIVDCISKTRINHAKEDLKNTSKTIKQIAEENGFLSSTVFINTFKKWEGITPGIYKNLNKK